MATKQNMPSRKEIGDCLQRLRIAAGYETAEAFALAVGFNVSTYTGYEQGKGMFSYEKAWIMADALHCSMDALGGRKSPTRYADSDQEQINRQYEMMNDEGKKQAMQAVNNTYANRSNRKSALDAESDQRKTA